MTDAMFELPSEKNVKEFVVTREYAEQRFEGLEPQLLKVA
jgi:ATP-dependent protease Clp ATPase subunit